MSEITPNRLRTLLGRVAAMRAIEEQREPRPPLAANQGEKWYLGSPHYEVWMAGYWANRELEKAAPELAQAYLDALTTQQERP